MHRATVIFTFQMLFEGPCGGWAGELKTQRVGLSSRLQQLPPGRTGAGPDEGQVPETPRHMVSMGVTVMKAGG